MRQINLQPAYILHSRAYQETSLLLEIFTLDHGRMATICKGARRKKNSSHALLQPFTPLLISCSGRGELLLLKAYEAGASHIVLRGRRLFSGFYINELLMRLLHRFDPHEQLFQVYSESLQALEVEPNEAIVLRRFERALLKAIGYELILDKDCETGLAIAPDLFYTLDPDRGLLKIETQSLFRSPMAKEGIYSGKTLIALQNEQKDQLTDSKIMQQAKHLMRQALQYRLGGRPLETRQLFC